MMDQTQRDQNTVIQSMMDYSAKIPQDIDESATARALAHLAVKHRAELGSDVMILVAAGTLLMRRHHQVRMADEQGGASTQPATGKE